MTKKILNVILIVFFLDLGSVSAQQQTGSIRGIVMDDEGNVLPGVKVIASSLSMMGKKSYMTKHTGIFRFSTLPPGTYTITTEMPGFKTIHRENVVIRAGMAVELKLIMEMAPIDEEITVTEASPVVDVEQSKLSVSMDQQLLRNAPFARDLYDIVNFTPGAISEEDPVKRTTSIHGATVRENTYSFDGVNMNDPVTMYVLTNINFDVMEEVEMVTAALPASVGFTSGAYINVVTRSGGNDLSGGGVIYYTNNRMAKNLWTDEEVESLGVSQPSVDKNWVDFSFNLGGPIIKDRLWFFTNLRLIQQSKIVDFVPYTDNKGRRHEDYDWEHQEKLGFIKLSSQIKPHIKLTGIFNYVERYRPVYEEPGYYNFIATRILDHEKVYTLNLSLDYILDQNNFLNFKTFYVRRWFPVLMQEEARDLPEIIDFADKYYLITSSSYNTLYLRKRFQSGVHFTRFQDHFLGGSHNLKAGLEFDDAYGDCNWWRLNNRSEIWYGDSYYFGENMGYLGFYTCGAEQGASKLVNEGKSFSAYLQDSVTFAERLTLNIGIRYDRSWGSSPAVTKERSGTELSYWLGETIIRPLVAANYAEIFPTGLNPFGKQEIDAWDNVLAWEAFSPRIGLTFDVFGNGRTACKASFSRYTNYIMFQYFATVHPVYPNSIDFLWIDLNWNQEPEKSDMFSLLSDLDYRMFDLEFSKKRIDPDISVPYCDEFNIGIWHELFKHFSLGINVLYKNWSNLLEDGIYDVDNSQWWYHPDQYAAQQYWIPFRTTVPSEVYGDKNVTFYVKSQDAPPVFYRLTNSPELKRKYWALEFLFYKRMAYGWQLNGSVIYSKAYGNIGSWFNESTGWSNASNGPNFFVNRYGRISSDRPLQIKLIGTVKLPHHIFLSGYYRFFSGAPLARRIRILPPEDWCVAHNAPRWNYYYVRLEPLGTFRGRSWNTLDLRIEKEFRIGHVGTLGAYIDIINVMGSTDLDVGKNEISSWAPEAEGYGQPGEANPNPSYGEVYSVSGLRVVKVSLRFSF